MSSSPITVVAVDVSSSLVAMLARVPDPRARRGVRHRLVGLLAVGVAATLAGARSFAAIGQWVDEAEEQTLASLGAAGGARPCESTIRRVFTALDGDGLDAVLGAYFQHRAPVVAGRRVIAFDGKTIRGARVGLAGAPHLVAAFDHRSGVVLGQHAVGAKTNEIPTLRALLAVMDLAGAVVTVDAMHTQTETARVITSAGADYAFTVKANQPSLYRALKALPWSQIKGHTTTQRGHGRRATRTLKALIAPDWVTFPGAAQVAQIRRTTTRGKTGKKSVEVVYVITSADHTSAPPAVLATWVQDHWGIENRLHWVRDVTFDEDRSQIRTGNAPRVMASLRSTAIGLLRLNGHTNIAAALRHHARQPDKIITLLTSRDTTLP